jgi:hypothetical protein
MMKRVERSNNFEGASLEKKNRGGKVFPSSNFEVEISQPLEIFKTIIGGADL